MCCRTAAWSGARAAAAPALALSVGAATATKTSRGCTSRFDCRAPESAEGASCPIPVGRGTRSCACGCARRTEWLVRCVAKPHLSSPARRLAGIGRNSRICRRSVGAGRRVGVVARDRHRGGSGSGAIEQSDERGAGIHSDADAGTEQRSLGNAGAGQARQLAVAPGRHTNSFSSPHHVWRPLPQSTSSERRCARRVRAGCVARRARWAAGFHTRVGRPEHERHIDPAAHLARRVRRTGRQVEVARCP